MKQKIIFSIHFNALKHKLKVSEVLPQVTPGKKLVYLHVAFIKILLRIPDLNARFVDKILAHRKFQTIRLTDLFKKVRPFVVTADYIPPTPQLDSLHFAKTFSPENSRSTQLTFDF